MRYCIGIRNLYLYRDARLRLLQIRRVQRPDGNRRRPREIAEQKEKARNRPYVQRRTNQRKELRDNKGRAVLKRGNENLLAAGGGCENEQRAKGGYEGLT